MDILLDLLLDLLLTLTGLRVLFYAVVVSTFALGLLSMSILVVGYTPYARRASGCPRHRRSIR